MNRLTLGQAKAARLAENVHLTPCHEDFLPLLNRAMEELLLAGRWWGTYGRMRICAPANCITWPREVMVPEKITLCRESIPVRNEWYEFMDFVRPPDTSTRDYCGNGELLDRGIVATFSEIEGANKKVRIYAANSADIGLRVLVQGLDGNGAIVRTLDVLSGSWVDGEWVTLTSPFSVTNATFSRITGFQKPLTAGLLRVYEYDTGTLTERQIAEYQPSEQNPMYRKQYFTGLLTVPTNATQTDGCSSFACSYPVLVAMVRLAFVPAVADTDYLAIGHLGAIEDMILSLQAKRKNNHSDSQTYRASAIRSLRQWTDAMTGGQRKTIVNMQPQGNAHPDRIFNGFV